MFIYLKVAFVRSTNYPSNTQLKIINMILSHKLQFLVKKNLNIIVFLINFDYSLISPYIALL